MRAVQFERPGGPDTLTMRRLPAPPGYPVKLLIRRPRHGHRDEAIALVVGKLGDYKPRASAKARWTYA